MEGKLGPLEKDFIMASMLEYTGGTAFSLGLQSHNLFYREGIKTILSERVHPIAYSENKKYMAEVKFSDFFLEKPKTADGQPMYPLDALQESSYLATFNATITLLITYKGSPIHKETTSVPLFKLPAAIMSTACNLIDAKPEEELDPIRYRELVKQAMRKWPYELFAHDTGIIIYLGNMYSSFIAKDMARNNLFYTFLDAPTDHLYPTNMMANILCDAAGLNAVNIIFTTEQVEETLMINWKINMTILSEMSFPLPIIFNIFNVFRPAHIMSLILDNVIPVMKERVRLLLIQVLETCPEILCNKQEVIQYIETLANKTNVWSLLVNMGRTELTPQLLCNILQKRLFPQIPVTEGFERVIHATGRLVAEFLQKYLGAETSDPLTYQRLKNIQLRRTFQGSVIHMANHHNKKQLTTSFQTYLQNPLTILLKGFCKTLQEQDTEDKHDVSSTTMAMVWNAIKTSELTNSICSLAIMRKNTGGEVIREPIRRYISGTSGSIARYDKSIAQNAFRVYHSEANNTNFRFHAHDSFPFNCPMATAEGDPGKIIMPTPTVMSPTCHLTQKDITTKLSDCMYFCDHTECPKVYMDSNFIGSICNPVEGMETIRQIRRTEKEYRFMTMVYREQEKRLIVYYSQEILFMPMVRVGSNITKYLAQGKEQNLNGIKFHQYTLITPSHLLNLANGSITMEDILKQGIIDLVSPIELENLFLCSDLPTLFKHENNPLLQYDYVVFSEQSMDPIMCSNPSVDNAPGQRSSFAWSQSKSAIEYGNSVLTRQKRSMFLPYASIPMALTSTASCFPTFINLGLIAAYAGEEGQEDGAIANAHAVGRFFGGMTCMSKLTVSLKSNIRLCAKGESPEIPDDFDENGLPKIGYTLLPDKICLVTTLTTGGMSHTIHRFNQNIRGIVINTSIRMHQDGSSVASIEYVFKQPLTESSKVSEYTGNKSVISKVKTPYFLPKTKTGISPVIICSAIMTPKRDIHDGVPNINAFYTLESGKFLVYQCGSPKNLKLPNEEFRNIHGIESNGLMYLITRYHNRTQKPISLLYKPFRRLDKQGSIECYHTQNPLISITTDQPVRGGRGKQGSFCNEEMSRWVIASEGATTYLSDTASDRTPLPICRKCNGICLTHKTLGIHCSNCHTSVYDIVTVGIGFKKLIDRMICCNIDTQLIPSGPDFDAIIEEVV